jgi:hypothetical protein
MAITSRTTAKYSCPIAILGNAAKASLFTSQANLPSKRGAFPLPGIISRVWSNPYKTFSDHLRRQPSRNHPSGFTVPLPCFFPLCLAGRLEIPKWSHKWDQAMGRSEIYYPTEASYLKSVLLWLQEYWTGPAVQVRPLNSVPQVSRYYSPRRTYAARSKRSLDFLHMECPCNLD